MRMTAIARDNPEDCAHFPRPRVSPRSRRPRAWTPARIGTADRQGQSFPQQLLAELGRGAVLYNLGIPGETTAAALTDELPAALAERPDLVTVFFNVDDLVAGVPAQDFEARLDQIVGSLRAGGHTRVLVANTPPLDGLPAFAVCQA